MPRPSVLLNGHPRINPALLFLSVWAVFDGVRIFNGTHPYLHVRISSADPSPKSNSGSSTNPNSPLQAWQSRQISPNPFASPKPTSQSPDSNSDSNSKSPPKRIEDYLTDSELKDLERIERELHALGSRTALRDAQRSAIEADYAELQKKTGLEAEAIRRRMNERMEAFGRDIESDAEELQKKAGEAKVIQRRLEERANADRMMKEAAVKAAAETVGRAGKQIEGGADAEKVKQRDDANRTRLTAEHQKTKVAEEMRRREKSAVSSAGAWVSLNGVPIPRLEALIAPFTKKD